MWLSQQAVRPAQSDPAGEIGVVTIAGARSAAQSGNERRNLTCLGPGGVVWLPERDSAVATLTCAGGETVILGAADQPVPAGMEPGDLYLRAGAASVWLHRDGRIELKGTVTVNGQPLLGDTE